jgi:hypothetical protein
MVTETATATVTVTVAETVAETVTVAETEIARAPETPSPSGTPVAILQAGPLAS